MSCSCDSRAVLVDTNLGTCFATPVSPDITVKALKRELKLVHLNFFPKVGIIRVNRMMVKRKSCYYHLSESMPLKDVFQGSNGAWFLHIEVEVASEAHLMIHPHNETPSESVSISGIITKYFSDYTEVASSAQNSFAKVRNKHKEQLNGRADCKFLDIQADIVSSPTGRKLLQASKDVWPEKPNSETFIGNKKLEVGSRLLLASSNLGFTQSNQRSTLSLCKFKNKRSTVSSATVKSSVFEITDEGH